MKEVREAIRALRAKAQTFNKLAEALEKLDKFSREYLPPKTVDHRHRKLSARGKAAIAVAQKVRWAKFRKAKLHVVRKAS